MGDRVDRTDEEWRRELTEERFAILREKVTERPFSGRYCDHEGRGTYLCAGCGARLFASDAKFASASGWPSFTAPLADGSVATEEDRSHGMVRTEVLCARCGGHLGHVFPDGPAPTGLRYCINSGALDFDDSEGEG